MSDIETAEVSVEEQPANDEIPEGDAGLEGSHRGEQFVEVTGDEDAAAAAAAAASVPFGSDDVDEGSYGAGEAAERSRLARESLHRDALIPVEGIEVVRGDQTMRDQRRRDSSRQPDQSKREERPRSNCRPRSRDPRQCQRHFREMIGKHEIRNDELEQRETDLRERLDMLECSMPAVMVWNIWRMAQGAPVSSLRNVVEKQFQGPASGVPECPTKPSQHWDCRVREVEAERKQAVVRAEEARQVFAAKEEAVKRQKERIEEARRLHEERREKIAKLEAEERQLREDLEKAKGDENFCETGECGEMGCRQMWLRDVASVNSIRSTDLECLARLQDLAEAELCMKRQIADLERRECAYMRTLQQADEMWAKMEDENANSVNDLQTQLDGKIAANQRLADRIVELEDELERLRKQLTVCQNQLTETVATLEPFLDRTFVEQGAGEEELGGTADGFGQTEIMESMESEAQVDEVETSDRGAGEDEPRPPIPEVVPIAMVDAGVGDDARRPTVLLVSEDEVQTEEGGDRRVGRDAAIDSRIPVQSIGNNTELNSRNAGTATEDDAAVAEESNSRRVGFRDGIGSGSGMDDEVDMNGEGADSGATGRATPTRDAEAEAILPPRFAGQDVEVQPEPREPGPDRATTTTSSEVEEEIQATASIADRAAGEENLGLREEDADVRIGSRGAESSGGRTRITNDEGSNGNQTAATEEADLCSQSCRNEVGVPVERIISWYKAITRLAKLSQSCSSCSKKMSGVRTMMDEMREYLVDNTRSPESDERALDCDCRIKQRSKIPQAETRRTIRPKKGPCICRPNACPLDPSSLATPRQPSSQIPSRAPTPAAQSNVQSQTAIDSQSQTMPASRIPNKDIRSPRTSRASSSKSVEDPKLTVIVEGNEHDEAVVVVDLSPPRTARESAGQDESTVTVGDTGSQTEAVRSTIAETTTVKTLNLDKAPCICPTGACPRMKPKAPCGECVPGKLSTANKTTRRKIYPSTAAAILHPAIKKLPCNEWGSDSYPISNNTTGDKTDNISSGSGTFACGICGELLTSVASVSGRPISRSGTSSKSKVVDEEFLCCTCELKNLSVDDKAKNYANKVTAKSKDDIESYFGDRSSHRPGKGSGTSCDQDACCSCDEPSLAKGSQPHDGGSMKSADCSCDLLLPKTKAKPETRDQSCLAKISRDKASKARSSRKKQYQDCLRISTVSESCNPSSASILGASREDSAESNVCCSSIEQALTLIKSIGKGVKCICEGQENKNTTEECSCDEQ